MQPVSVTKVCVVTGKEICSRHVSAISGVDTTQSGRGGGPTKKYNGNGVNTTGGGVDIFPPIPIFSFNLSPFSLK